MMVDRALYQSRNLVGRDSPEILKIIATALGRNPTLAVTGILYFDPERFVQYIEGDPDGVSTLMRAILADPRHAVDWSVTLAPRNSRLFPGIDMGFFDGTRRDGARPADPLARAAEPAEAEALVAGLMALPIKTAPDHGRRSAEAPRLLFRSPPGDSSDYRIERPPTRLVDRSEAWRRMGTKDDD